MSSRLAWRVSRERSEATRLEVRFSAIAGGTRVDLTHAGWEAYGDKGEFRSAQITARIDPEQIRELVQMLVDRVDEIEEDDHEVMVVTLVAHPATSEPSGAPFDDAASPAPDLEAPDS